MFKIETTDYKEARRFRIAQFNGRTVTAKTAGTAVTGYVRAIVENKSRIPAAWVITIIPEEPKPVAPAQLRPAAPKQPLVEDNY
jgi:hypothetical protein